MPQKHFKKLGDDIAIINKKSNANKKKVDIMEKLLEIHDFIIKYRLIPSMYNF